MSDIYLDHNATTAPWPEVVELCGRAMRELAGNPSSVHRAGQRAKNALEHARGQVAALIDASPTEIVLTSGATEANQLAIRGAVRAAVERGMEQPAVVISAAEHPSVWGAAELAVEAHGGELVVVGLDDRGRLRLEALEAELEARAGSVALISVMAVQNEIGNAYPVREVGMMARAAGVPLHCDATQAVGRVPVDVDAWGTTLMSLSGHKFGGPKGAGALYVRRGAPLSAIWRGGHQERGRRAGTENVWGLVGLGAACDVAGRRGLEAWREAGRMGGLLAERLVEGVDGAQILGERTGALGNTVCVAFPGTRADEVLMGLDLEGVAVSAGSACSSGSLEPSPVLEAMGMDAEVAQSAVRFSTGPETTESEIARVVEIVQGVVSHMRSVHGRTGEVRWM